MQKNRCTVFVYLPGETDAVPAGILADTGEGFFFHYGKKYLTRKDAIPVDMLHLPLGRLPQGHLPLEAEPFFLEEGKLGAIRDAAPDFWGRLVFETLSSVAEPGEIDYLLSPGAVRIGNLDFRETATDAEPPFIVARYADLPEIIEIAEMIDEGAKLDERQKKVAVLLRCPLGGARPKCVVNIEGSLWLAKFPAKNDSYCNAKLEAVAMSLAKKAGVAIPEIRVENIAERDVFLIRRFDRPDITTRTPYMSALTMLSISEYDHQAFSYLAVAEKIRKYGKISDLEQLFRRIVVNVLLRNTDDHPRNHGFLFRNGHWELAPAFDVTPTASAKGVSSVPRLSMAPGLMGKEGSLENLLSAVGEFGLNAEEGEAVFSQCVDIVRTNWRKEFQYFDVSEEDAEKFHDTFSAYENINIKKKHGKRLQQGR